MRRTQIYIDEELDRELRQTAAAEGRSAAAVIRDAVRTYLSARDADADADSDDPILRAAGRLGGLDPNAATEHDRVLYGGGSVRATRRGRSA